MRAAPLFVVRKRRLRTRAYFVTLQTWSRGPLFGRIAKGKMRRNSLGREIAACWNRIPRHFGNVALDTFVVMPDHLHGIVEVAGRPTGDAASLDAVLDCFRSVSAAAVDCSIWRGGDRRKAIRDRDELERIRHYIKDNPARWPQDSRDLPPFCRS